MLNPIRDVNKDILQWYLRSLTLELICWILTKCVSIQNKDIQVLADDTYSREAI